MKQAFLSLSLIVLLASGCDGSGESERSQAGDVPADTVDHATAQPVNGNSGAEAASHMAQWLKPPIPDLILRSEEEKQQGMQEGRALPVLKTLQPSLDAELPAFVPALDPLVSGSFMGGASDVLPGLVNAWIAAFNQTYPNVQIEIAKPYAGSLGMLQVIEGNYDFVFVSRELKPTDISSFTEKYGYAPFSLPVSGGSYDHYGFLDAIGFFVNVENPLEKLSFEQIDQLFSSTHHRGGKPITTWGELGLGGSWKDQPVHLYGVEPWNGFEEFVRQRVLDSEGKRGEWREGINYSHTAFPIAEMVANDPLAIGYTGLAYITRGVKVLPLAVSADNAEYVAADYEHVADASYPLSRLIFLNMNKAPGKKLDPILEEFSRFILSREGQQLVLDQAVYLPLQNWQATAGRASLD